MKTNPTPIARLCLTCKAWRPQTAECRAGSPTLMYAPLAKPAETSIIGGAPSQPQVGFVRAAAWPQVPMGESCEAWRLAPDASKRIAHAKAQVEAKQPVAKA